MNRLIRPLALALLLCCAVCSAQDTQSVVVEPGKFKKIDVPFKASVFTAPLSDRPKLEGRLYPVEGGYLLTLGGDCTSIELVFLGSPKKNGDQPPMVPVIAKLEGAPEPGPDPPGPGPGPDPKPDPDPQPTPTQVGFALVVYEKDELASDTNVAILMQSDFLQRVFAAGGKARFYEDDHPNAGQKYREELAKRGVEGAGILHYSLDGKEITDAFSLKGMEKAAVLARLGVK